LKHAMHTVDIAGAPAANHIFTPDMGWTRDIPASRKLDCVAAAEEMFARGPDSVAEKFEWLRPVHIASCI
jgi:hypothetical protein